MPQFNPEWFASQVFWLVVIFAILYFLMARIALPRIGSVLEERQEKIENDLAKAEQLRTEAEQVMEEYEKALAEARSEAQKRLKEASDKISEEQSKRHEEFGKELAEKTKSAEERIAKAKEEAMDNLRNVAVDVAAAVSEKLIGVEHKRETVEEAVDTAMKENA